MAMRLGPTLVRAALFALPSVLSATAQAQAPASLSVWDAVDRALAQHPTVKAGLAAEAEAHAGLAEARAARLPTLQVSASATQYQKPMIVSPIHGFLPGLTPPFDETLLQGVVRGSFTLYDGGARAARIDRAHAEIEAAEAASGNAEALTIAQVATGYSRILGRVQVLDAHDRRIAALEAERRRVEQLLEVGRAARLDVLRVSAAIDGARAERVRMAEALDGAERDLARLLDADPQDTRAGRLVAVRLADAQIPEREALAESAVRASPAIEEARRRLAAAETAIGVAASARSPRLNVVGSHLVFGSAAGHVTSEWSAGVQIAYPLFDGGTTGHQIARARAARERAAEHLRTIELQVLGDLDRALSAVRETATRLASLESVVAQLAEVVRIEQLRLEAGIGIQTDYLCAEAELLSARAGLADARYGELIARVELARTAGQLDRDWPRQALRETP